MKTEDIRLEEFRQLRNEIRGSVKHLVVGIDIAKEKHNVFFGTATGKTVCKGLIIENSRQGFEKLLTHTESVKVQNNLRKVVFGMEPTANYHKPLGEYLIRHDHEVVLVSGNAVKNNRELLGTAGVGNSMILKDSANVADLISQGKFQYYEYPCIEVRDLRELLFAEAEAQAAGAGSGASDKNNLLAQYFPEMERYYGNCRG